MNVLFYTSYKCSPTKGGTERTTISVATGLRRYYGCHCYSVYGIDADTSLEGCFDAGLLWNSRHDEEELRRFLTDYHIDWIVDQGSHSAAKTFREVTKGTDCKIIFAHHFEPGWEEHFFSYKGLLDDIRRSTTWMLRIKGVVKFCLFPLLRWRYLQKLPQDYNDAYRMADKVVLLGQGFIPAFMAYGRIGDSSKFRIIPNGLSYEDSLPTERIARKKPVVLIVSRLDDPPKRLSLALTIWNKVKRRPESERWRLIIIGHGPYENTYRKMIDRMKIPDVQMLGRRDPKAYYEESSIFMMTSKSEGWGLTLTEAQQFGCVPIAFNSYASLQDIITNGEDGVIIPECDVDRYVRQLVHLMVDRSAREAMAAKAISSSQRFSQKKVAREWWKLFTETNG